MASNALGERSVSILTTPFINLGDLSPSFTSVGHLQIGPSCKYRILVGGAMGTFASGKRASVSYHFDFTSDFVSPSCEMSLMAFLQFFCLSPKFEPIPIKTIAIETS